jgi:hypothetical protein
MSRTKGRDDMVKYWILEGGCYGLHTVTSKKSKGEDKKEQKYPK